MIARYNKQLLILILGAIVLLPFLGSTHLFDWDEINFAESSREMMLTGNYFQNQINFEPFWEKPPFFFWVQSLSMLVFGQNEFGARFPNVLFGLITLIFVFNIGKRLYNERFGIMWVLLYVGTILPHMYIRSGIIDPIFNLFIFASVYYFVRTIEDSNHKKSRKYAAVSGLFIGLAIITKGPVGLLILLLSVSIYWILNRFRPLASLQNLLLFISVAFLTSILWFGYETIQNGPWFLIEFVGYQIELLTGAEGGAAAGHQQPFYYHFVVVLFGCFPISILALGNVFGSKYLEDKFHFKRWMNILFWVVMILFSIVSTKIIHYSSMVYLPLSFLATYFLFQVDRGREKVRSWMRILVLLFGTLYALVLVLIPVIAKKKDDWLIPLVQDPFVQSGLSMDVNWSGFEITVGILFGIVMLMAASQLFKNNVFRYTMVNAVGVAIFMLGSSIWILPKIEQYVQGPAVEFCESLQNHDVYIWPIGYKSYTHYFYAKTQPLDKNSGLAKQKATFLSSISKEKSNQLNGAERLEYIMSMQDWLLHGAIDKPVYFLLKVNNYSPEQFPELDVVMNNGGFIGLKRTPE